MSPVLDNTLRLGIKELRSLRADPIMLVLIAYIFTYVVYAIATGVNFEVQHAAVGIVDEDRSQLSRRIGLAILEPYFKTPVEPLGGPDRQGARFRRPCLCRRDTTSVRAGRPGRPAPVNPN